LEIDDNDSRSQPPGLSHVILTNTRFAYYTDS